VEEQRGQLIVKQTENDRKEADTKAYAMEAMLKPIRDLDWKVLTALAADGGNARQNVALGFRQLAENAEKIGTLNISPDLLESLLQDGKKK
jgi:hypothetical protein